MKHGRDEIPFPIVARADTGVRIALNTKLLLERIAENRLHPLDNDPMLKAMQSSLRLLFIRARRGRKKSSENSFAIHKWRGDEKSIERLFEIHKLLYPDTHDLPVPVERALDVRHLMCELSYLVSPAKSDPKSDHQRVLAGPVRLVESASDSNPKLYELAERQWKRGATLKSLAVRVFLERLQDKGITTIDEKIIDRDLAALQEWDDMKTGGKSPGALRIIFSTGESLPYQFHTQKWMARKRGSRSLSDK